MTSTLPPGTHAADASLPVLTSVGPARLFAGLVPETMRLDRVAHLTVHGALPAMRSGELVELAENIGLRGRGGAGFPFARKLRSVLQAARRQDGRTAVVVNGSEGEPSCLKDTALLLHTPHLVLDGALLAAAALGAGEVRVGVTRADVLRSVGEAIAERGPTGARLRVSRLPERFVTGESSAMTSALNDGPALPTGRGVRTSESGLYGLPTLLSNTETFAQLAVAARLGALGYRATGLPGEPGTVLLTVGGEYAVETPSGMTLPHILRLCGTTPGQGVLVGGYHGRFLSPEAAQSALISRQSLTALGATLGAGAVLPLPEETCPVGETIAVAGWMGRESAGQCGPCVLGLPALTEALVRAADGGGAAALDAVRARIRALARRGACSHPDGTSRFVESALDAFSGDFRQHALGRPCGRPVLGTLPLPPDTGRVQEAARGRRGDGKTERLVVNWTLCQGHGLCADAAPDLIRLGADGYPEAARAEVPGPLRKQAQRAVRRCPALALRLHG